MEGALGDGAVAEEGHRHASRRARSWAAVAAPTAIGRPAATIPLAPKIPSVGSAMCIEPPRPRLVPSLLAHELGEHPERVEPLGQAVAVAAVGGRDDVVGASGQQAPTADASCPIERWTKPGTSPSR